jgi:diacylglycerol O-acyltransferase / wax synthase
MDGPLERLSAADLMQIWPEDEGWPQDIGAIAILDGQRLPDAESGFLIDAARRHIEGRLHLLPRFRQVIHWPGFGRGWPLWIDAPVFDISHHVGILRVPPPGDETQLLLTCEKLRRRRLDPSRPLWEMWFLPGLSDGRVGFLMKLHHAVADGVAGIAALGAFVDATPDPPAMEAPPWVPAPKPSDGEIFRDNVRRRLQELNRALSALAEPIETFRRIQRAWPAVREMFMEGRAPRTSLNRRIGSDRRLAVVRGSLDVVRQIGHAHGGTVNDVLLTALAGGYADLLSGRGEHIGSLVLRAFVPVSLHREDSRSARGNLDGGMVAPLPIGEPDHVRRLYRIAAETAERKKKVRPQGGILFRNVLIQRTFLRLMPRQRFMNAYVANVPGPPIPMYFAGAPVLELFPVVPIMGNMSIGVGALSYTGQLNITAVADRDVCPDLEAFMGGVRSSLQALDRSLNQERSVREEANNARD